MAKRHRSWVLTLNNYSEEEWLQVCEFLKHGCVWGIVGKEIGSEGTPHLQGAFTRNPSTLETVRKLCGERGHYEVMKGNQKQAREYCLKEGDFVEFGEIPKQGKRSDIKAAREHLKEGGNMRSLVDIAKSYQSIKCGEVILKYQEEERNWKPEVQWYFGDSGSGKTRTAHEYFHNSEDRYIVMGGKWWEGYDKHPDVLIDDFRPDAGWEFNYLLRVLDRYAMRIECKGGSRQLLARRIIITSPKSPQETFSYLSEENITQLLRRIDYIYLFTAGQPTRRISTEEQTQMSGGNTNAPDFGGALRASFAGNWS